MLQPLIWPVYGRQNGPKRDFSAVCRATLQTFPRLFGQFQSWCSWKLSWHEKRAIYCGLCSSCIMSKGDENDGDGQDPPRPGSRWYLDHQEAAAGRCSYGPDDPAHCARSHDWTAPYDPCRLLGT